MIQYKEMNFAKKSPFRNATDDSDESPPSGPYPGSDERLFHLEMSDEGSSGGKRTKLDTEHFAKTDLNPMASLAAIPSQKRGAVHPLTNSASDLGSKKARKMGSHQSSEKPKFVKPYQIHGVPRPLPTTGLHGLKMQPMNFFEEETFVATDDDPHMARAAIYYLMAQEDRLSSKQFYDGKNRINQKSVTITVKSRQKLLNWLFLVNQQFSYDFDTWILTASILDRFLSAQPIDKDVFQLSGCAAFLLAAKHEERDPPKISELENLCAQCYMKNDFIKMERIMLKVLEYKLVFPSVNVLLREICLLKNINLSTEFVVTMIKRITLHNNLAYMPPSTVVFTLINAADQCTDVEKCFKYLLFCLKQDPLENLYDDEP